MDKGFQRLRLTHCLRLAVSLGEAAFGGMERNVLDLVRELALREADVELLALLPSENPDVVSRLRQLEPLAKVSFCLLTDRRPAWTMRRRFPLHAAAVASAFAARRNRLIHLHVANTDLLQQVLGHLLSRSGVVVSQHSAMPSFRRARDRAAVRFGSKFVDQYVAVSESVRSTLVEHGGIDAGRITVVEPGIPEVSAIRERVEARNDLGLPAVGFIVGYVGRLVPMKNVDTLIAAAARVPELLLVIVGDGIGRSDLEARVVRDGVTNVRFLGYRADSREILRAFDLVALVSDWEGNPVSLIEAMLAGVPVLGSAVPGTAELVQDGDYGLLVPRRDVDALVAKLREAMKAGEQLSLLGRRAQDRALRRFSGVRMAREMERVYWNVVSKRQTPGSA